MTLEEKFFDLVQGYFGCPPTDVNEEVLTQLYDFFAGSTLATAHRITKLQEVDEVNKFIARHIQRVQQRQGSEADKEIVMLAKEFTKLKQKGK